MDILNQYNQDRLQTQTPTQQPVRGMAPSSEGFLIRLVIKLSGGKIQDHRQILIILGVFAGLALLASVLFIFQNIGITEHPLIKTPLPGSETTAAPDLLSNE